ncbi:MAG: YtxH domain-containing protein [Bacteroidota bacterium]
MNAGKVLLGWMIALGTGAVLGMLFAPDKGSVTRRKLLKQGDRYVGAVKNTANESLQSITDSFASAKDAATGISDRVKGAVDSLAGHEPHKHVRGT